MQRSAKIFTLSLAASAALHLLLFAKIPSISLMPPPLLSYPPPLKATLQKAPSALTPPVQVKTKVSAAAPKQLVRPLSPLLTIPDATPEIIQPEQHPVLANADAKEKISPPPPVTDTVPPPPPITPAVVVKPPARADLTFTGYKGEQEDIVADATLTWRADHDAYSSMLSLNAYAVYEFVLSSRGTITAQGLQPAEATTRQGFRLIRRKITHLQFDWSSGIATLSGNTQNTFSLPSGAQDQLSALHQLFFSPTTGDNADMVIVSDRKIDTHHYQLNAETLVTPLGNLKTVHYREQRSGDASFEFWLATEYQNLPVKIGFALSGTPYYFLISKISVQQ